MRKSYEKQNDLDFQALYLFKLGDGRSDLGGTRNGIFDVLDISTTLTVFEAIDEPFISGELAIVDNNKLMQTLDIKENCYLVGVYRTPLPTTVQDNLGGVLPEEDVESNSVIIMKIDGIKERVRSPKQNGEYIVFRLSSVSKFLDQLSITSKSIQGIGTKPIVDIAEETFYDRNNPWRVDLPNLTDKQLSPDYSDRGIDLFDTRYEFLKQYNLSESATPVRHAFPFSTASRKIKSICDDLTSTQNNPGYLFWETLTGFKIASYQSLFEGVPFFSYSKTLADSRGDQTSDERIASLYNIQSFTCNNNNRRDFQVRGGAFKSDLHEFDITTKQYTKRTFDYHNQNPYSDKIGSRFPVKAFQPFSSYKSETTNPGTIISFDVASFRFDESPNTPDRNLYIDDEGEQEMISQRILFDDTTLSIVVAGNHMIEAGRMVRVTIPQTGPSSNQEQLDDAELSGVYVVRNVGHTFELLTGTHKMSLVLSRNFRNDIPPTINLDQRSFG